MKFRIIILLMCVPLCAGSDGSLITNIVRLSPPEQDHVRENGDVKLQCQTSLSEQKRDDSIVWFRNSSKVHAPDATNMILDTVRIVNDTLLLKRVRRDSSSWWSCDVNRHSSNSLATRTPYFISVKYAPDSPVITCSDKSVRAGQDTTVLCTISDTGNPPGSVKWYKGNTEINPTSVGNTYKIPVDTVGAIKYKCYIESPLFQAKPSNECIIDVRGPPLVESCGTKVSYKPHGLDIDITCIVSGTDVESNWKYDKEIMDSHRNPVKTKMRGRFRYDQRHAIQTTLSLSLRDTKWISSLSGALSTYVNITVWNIIADKKEETHHSIPLFLLGQRNEVFNKGAKGVNVAAWVFAVLLLVLFVVNIIVATIYCHKRRQKTKERKKRKENCEMDSEEKECITKPGQEKSGVLSNL